MPLPTELDLKMNFIPYKNRANFSNLKKNI